MKSEAPDPFLENAELRKSQGRSLKNSELTALSQADRIARRPISDNYKPLGANPNQLNDRIHSVYETSNPPNTAYSTYTFTACVSGVPKNFVIPIVSGPT